MDVQVFKRASQYEPDTEAAQKYAAFTPLSIFYQKKSSNVYVDNGLCVCVYVENYVHRSMKMSSFSILVTNYSTLKKIMQGFSFAYDSFIACSFLF